MSEAKGLATKLKNDLGAYEKEWQEITKSPHKLGKKAKAKLQEKINKLYQLLSELINTNNEEYDQHKHCGTPVEERFILDLRDQVSSLEMKLKAR